MTEKNEIGLAIVGGGVVGRIRALLARDYPGVKRVGACPDRSSRPLFERLRNVSISLRDCRHPILLVGIGGGL